MNPDYRITARNLGSLELEGTCRRCFWYLSALRFHPPFNTFGAAIFNDCQAMQEAVIGHYLEKDGRLPKQFAPFCDIKARVDVNKSWKTYGYTHNSGEWLYGSPDEVFYRADGTVLIWDHKTAHPKDEQTAKDSDGKSKKKVKPDRFLPQYQVQVIGYGMIAEVGLKLGRVSAGALGYWDVQRDAVVAEPAKYIRDGMLWAPFAPKVHPVEIDYSRIDKLLKEAIAIWESGVPPEGEEKCKECKKAEALFAIQTAIEDELSLRDQKALKYSGNDIRIQRRIMSRLHDMKSARLAACLEIRDADESLNFDESSMAANWEFFPDEAD